MPAKGNDIFVKFYPAIYMPEEISRSSNTDVYMSNMGEPNRLKR